MARQLHAAPPTRCLALRIYHRIANLRIHSPVSIRCDRLDAHTDKTDRMERDELPTPAVEQYNSLFTNTTLEHSDTVNPADLAFPSAKIGSATPQDAQQASPAQDNMWNGAPIYAGEPNVSFGQGTQLPTTGWEQQIWTGDLSYSSYGSSLPDNSFGWQNLVHRFGEHNIAMSPNDGLNSFAMSRNVSFSASEQYPSPAPANFSDTTKTQKSRPSTASRGCAHADMSVSGTETVFEDSDSHHSWTAADNLEAWCARFRERLLEFRRHKDRVSIVTSPLQVRQRRKVHSMANLWGLSHMSIGAGRSKEMLVSKCELTSSTSEKRWNPTRNNWSPGLVDPRIILFDFVSLQLSAGRIQQCLREAGLPCPTKLTVDYKSNISPMPQYATVYALFSNVEEAMETILALDSSRPNWNSIDANIEADFVHFPPGFDLSDNALQSFDSLPDLIRTEKARLAQQRALFRSSANIYPSETDEETEDDLVDFPDHKSTSKTPRQRFFRKPSNESSQSRDPEYVSATNSDQEESETSTTRKRRRVPKILGGYVCSFEDCRRAFDREGDRRKHEKNHGGKRPHVCSFCGKGFLFPKDLRRHIKGVHEGGNGIGSDAGGGGPSEVEGVTQRKSLEGWSSRSFGTDM